MTFNIETIVSIIVASTLEPSVVLNAFAISGL